VTVPIPLSFTKLIEDDLERSAAYYEAMFGLDEVYRVALVGFLADPDGHVAEVVQPAVSAA
jgi:hypothetical protein